MKNIHLIPTDKPSRLYLHSNNELQLRTNIIRTSEDYLGTNQNIYISSDEEIKEGDWIILDNSIKELPEYQGLHVIQIVDNTSLKSAIALNCKKIILTTDQDLIADSVQAIDDTFLEWFVKNPSCEYVNVKDFPTTEKYNSKGEYIHNSNWIYKIIIPKEEPKQEWNPTQGEEVWMKVFSNWSKGTYIGYDVVKQTHIVREEEKGGGHLFSSIEVLPYYAMPNEPQQETLEQSYQRGYERGLNALIPLIENLNKEITELKRNLYIR